MCAFPKRKLNVQFWDFPKIAAFWENPEKFWSNLAKIQQNSGKSCNIFFFPRDGLRGNRRKDQTPTGDAWP